MKKNLILLSLFCGTLPIFVNAQTSHTSLPIDSRLYEAFDGEYLNTLSTSNPFLLQRWNYYLDHACYIVELPPEKSKADQPSVRIDDLNSFNIFLLEKSQNLKRDWNKRMVYKIENTNQALVFYSGVEFNQQLSEFLKK